MNTRRRIQRILRAKLAAAVAAATRVADDDVAAALDYDLRDPPRRQDARLQESLAVLELQPGATVAQVKAAYKRLCKRYHPDRFAHDPRKAHLANELQAAINAAYAYLTKSGAR